MLAIVMAIVFSLEVDIFIGNARFGPLNTLGGAILSAVIGGFMFVAGWNMPGNDKSGSSGRRRG